MLTEHGTATKNERALATTIITVAAMLRASIGSVVLPSSLR